MTPGRILLVSPADSGPRKAAQGKVGCGMKRFALVLWGVMAAGTAAAQDVWLQIEAQPTQREAEERARAYSGVFPNVRGFDLGNGWYGIVLGPFDRDEAEQQLRVLKSERMIPGDSYIAEGDRFEEPFWPAGAAAPAPALPAPAPEASAPVPEAAPAVIDEDETPGEARAAEAGLTTDERKLIQSALQWNGVYAGAIDGAFGPGTRKSMAAWQAAQGHEETGVLTSRQRRALVDGYQSEVAALGFETVREQEAGIEITLPGKLVSFDRYEPPFVQYGEEDGSGFRVLLISQQGDENTLFGLYDLMQTLEIVPLEGERERKKSAFVLTGKNGEVESYTQAELRGGLIRGFTLVWKPTDAERAARVLEAMKASFKPFGDRALDEGLGQPSQTARGDLVSGLEVRHPAISRSGFYADAAGTVVTTSEVLKNCARVTIDGLHEAEVIHTDAATGIAVLKPREALAPAVHAVFRPAQPRAGSEVAVAGYSYEEALDAPVLTFGTFESAGGLDGETDRVRLSLSVRAGDAGGPVLDSAGTVVGMLLPREEKDGRVLPPDVAFAANGATLSAALTKAGVAAAPVTETGAMAAEDVAARGRGMAVLVSCWE